ncbi:MAG: hypothetical protein J6Y71_01740 [Ruminococcus sp.]|nr:hypothetical protein [Ruminococcus sp.]
MKIEKNRKMKGSVLLTVVSVMALLIVFMTAALALSTSMNNRAHANYSDSQAEYTAKAAIQSFTQAIHTNEAVAQTLLNMDIGDVVTPSVIVSDTGMGNVGYYNSDGEWVRDKITIEYVKDNMAYDGAQNAWVPMQVIKITATGKVGKQEKSVSYYIERASVETKSSSIKGFQTLGGGGHQNNGEITGALTMGLKDGGDLEYGFKNDYSLRTDVVFVNGDFTKTDGNSIEFNVVKPNTQYVIMGDFTVRGSKFTINLDYPFGKSDSTTGKLTSENMTQQNIPYLYVKGNLGASTGMTSLIVKPTGVNNIHELREGAPFNIFCGTIGASTSRTLPTSDDPSTSFSNADRGSWGGVDINGADLYLLNSLDDESVGHDSYLDPANESNLYKWSDSVLNGTASKFYSEGGSIYCNHNLHIGKKLTVRGNLIVQGNLEVNEGLVVEGDLAVKGDITGMDKITVNGNWYYSGGGGAPTSVWVAHNIPNGGGLKSDCREFENVEIGNIFVENAKLPNVPAESEGEVVTIAHEEYPDMDSEDFYHGPSSNWNWTYSDGSTVNDAELIAVLNANKRWVSDHDECTMYEVDGDYYPQKCYVDVNGYITTEAEGIYYYIDGQYCDVAPDGAYFYKVDKDGNILDGNIITDEIYTMYKVSVIAEKQDDGSIEYITVTTDEETDENGAYYVASANGGPTATEAYKYSYYHRVDPDTGNPTDDIADSRYSYYQYDEETGKYTEISEDEAFEEESTSSYKAWYDETTIVLDECYYYDADPTSHKNDSGWLEEHEVDPADLGSVGGKYPIAAYPGYHDGSVYPANMTDENITVGNQKIVMSLAEARENIGMTAAGTFTPGTYETSFDSDTVGFKEEANTYTQSGSNMVITKSGTLTGMYDNCVVNIKPKDNSDVINIVMKDCTFRNGASILVESKGLVNILFEGTNTFAGSGSLLGFSAGAGIYTTHVVDQIKSSGRINETDKMNIIMYGKAGSELRNENTGLFCGIAKCPYTYFNNPATQGVTGSWKYVMGTGQIWEPAGVNWIGSALFERAMTNDNFVLLYTNAAEGGDSISNDGVDGANWYGKYYDAY